MFVLENGIKFREFCYCLPPRGPRFADIFVDPPKQYSLNFAIENAFSHALQYYSHAQSASSKNLTAASGYE